MSDVLEPTALRAALIALLNRSQAHEEAFRGEFSEAEREQVGTADNWAPKEVIAHLAYWKNRQSARVEAMARGEEAPESEDWGMVNTETWPEHAHLTWDESVKRSDDATGRLIAAVRALPESALTNPDDQESEANLLFATTMGNSIGHVAEHMANHYRSLGQTDRAMQVQQEVVQAIVDAHLGASAEGGARYNLACYYALHGQPDDAISELRDALAKRPDLIPWARQDHDLDSLREDAAFQALVPPEDK
ncbi:MAG TPA: DinB family protein [Ktedonobacterales bacterium]|jgi:tetratricopeptide (TPR) repeat protein|nr:DinB family protein [Ktedonobacterales bacterium]